MKIRVASIKYLFRIISNFISNKRLYTLLTYILKSTCFSSWTYLDTCFFFLLQNMKSDTLYQGRHEQIFFFNLSGRITKRGGGQYPLNHYEKNTITKNERKNMNMGGGPGNSGSTTKRKIFFCVSSLAHKSYKQFSTQ